MKKVRKVFSGVIICILFSCILAACGKEKKETDPNSEKKTYGDEVMQEQEVDDWKETDLVLACNGAGSIKREVKKFNKNNKKYSIQIKDYSSYDAPAEQLNMDIAAGNVPDIVMIDFIPVSRYIKKGILADLSGFLASDAEIKKEDFLDSVLASLEKNGKLYFLPPFFSVDALLGSTDVVGNREAWSFDEMELVFNQMKEDSIFMTYETKEWFLKVFLKGLLDRFVDWENNSPDFESEDFVRLLEFSNRFPYEKDLKMGSQENLWKLAKEKKLMLLGFNTIFDVELGNKLWENKGGVSILSYPNGKSDPALKMNAGSTAMAVTEQCGDKEGAWEFIRTFLTEDYQSENSNSWAEIPSRKDVFDVYLEHAMTEEPYVDAYGITVDPVQESWMFDGQEIKISPLKKKEAKQVVSMMERIGKCSAFDDMAGTVVDVAVEEASAYYLGDKTAMETAGIIQKKVSIYLSENDS